MYNAPEPIGYFLVLEALREHVGTKPYGIKTQAATSMVLSEQAKVLRHLARLLIG